MLCPFSRILSPSGQATGIEALPGAVLLGSWDDAVVDGYPSSLNSPLNRLAGWYKHWLLEGLLDHTLGLIGHRNLRREERSSPMEQQVTEQEELALETRTRSIEGRRDARWLSTASQSYLAQARAAPPAFLQTQ